MINLIAQVCYYFYTSKDVDIFANFLYVFFFPVAYSSVHARNAFRPRSNVLLYYIRHHPVNNFGQNSFCQFFEFYIHLFWSLKFTLFIARVSTLLLTFCTYSRLQRLTPSRKKRLSGEINVTPSAVYRLVYAPK